MILESWIPELFLQGNGKLGAAMSENNQLAFFYSCFVKTPSAWVHLPKLSKGGFGLFSPNACHVGGMFRNFHYRAVTCIHGVYVNKIRAMIVSLLGSFVPPPVNLQNYHLAWLLAHHSALNLMNRDQHP